jgi:6-pyruvoyltetrahydropterin/6-carboxytetrahydropterin synthase
MYKINKRFTFSASHMLEGLSDGHPCARLHGHNYVVTLHLRTETLNEIGFVADYHDLDFVKKYIDRHLDHRHLNDVLEFNPSAENIAKYLFDLFREKLPRLYALEVSETPKTSAIYEVDGE